MKFRKKPVIIEAIQYKGCGMFSEHQVPGWIWRALEDKILEGTNGNDPFIIHTFEGNMAVSINDWIIRGIKGELYPIKNDIFLETYEKVLDK